jgi:hypothetical protein
MTSLPSVSRMSRKCMSLDVSQPCYRDRLTLFYFSAACNESTVRVVKRKEGEMTQTCSMNVWMDPNGRASLAPQ